MFGWHPRLPIDVFFGMDPNTESGDHSTYVAKLKDRMASAFSVASSEAKRIATKNKDQYDLKVRYSKLEVGDRVLVRKVGIKGKHKLADKWDSEVYTVPATLFLTFLSCSIVRVSYRIVRVSYRIV